MHSLYNYTSLVSHGSYVTSLSSLTGLTSLVCHGSYATSLVIIINMLTAEHRTPDTATDVIFCPMLSMHGIGQTIIVVY